MNGVVEFPACSKCNTPLPAAAINPGQFAPCPHCDAEIWAEIFPALSRPISKGNTGEAVMVAGESTCFYHEAKKAVTVCDACGRFLCGLCDCELAGKHFCPGCLESGSQKGRDRRTGKRPGRCTGSKRCCCPSCRLASRGWRRCFIALRYWKAPRQPGPPAAVAAVCRPDFGDSPKRWVFGIMILIAFK